MYIVKIVVQFYAVAKISQAYCEGTLIWDTHPVEQGEKYSDRHRQLGTPNFTRWAHMRHTVNENGGKFHLYWWSNISTSMVEIFHPHYHGGKIHLK